MHRCECQSLVFFKIKGVGNVFAGLVERGFVKLSGVVVFSPSYTRPNPCTGISFTVEMHPGVDFVNPGDGVGLIIKVIDKKNMLSFHGLGDVMMYKKDATLGQARECEALFRAIYLELRQSHAADGRFFCSICPTGDTMEPGVCRYCGACWPTIIVRPDFLSGSTASLLRLFA